ncbi:hypothetical protein ACSCB1_20185 [Streptomyces europaeiscabiei]|uniref:hypothetical protein n=1 Tax=Streptomyces europaeiscabiei TaxID=146819 RepID=UPI0006283185|nr:hypothetical protein [Streptomyces europaeiscabiei]MDX2526587.1 hypothetical protein [Streptomyces europaeiscabiei]MDX2759332.1 hypothetical protein [Streptomyces europaeiscabiei]MDX2773589.1 hypothetical protein [Streptomyces europaeiscabiei]MDX3711361.1 hypothetical protein [Streptomyces europaeiscabiei]MDX3839969.1 hypothetical protein [Streptomyces europaeiscabiei]
MQQADDATEAALAAGERTTTHTTRLGGKDVSAQVQSWQLERSYATDLPAAMRAFSGSSAAQLQVQLSGKDGVSAPELYAPWALRATGDIARPGQSVVHRGGVGATTLPAFRGTVRSRSAQAGTDTVQLTALDGAERLRGPAQLPKPYAGFSNGRPVATATWCVDELLRQAGVLTAPPARYPEFAEGRPLTLVHASLHGGFAAPYGQPELLPPASSYTWTRDGAPHEMALLPRQTGVTASWFPRSRITVPGTRLFAEAWVNPALGPGDEVALELLLDRTGTARGSLRMEVNFAEGTVRMVSATVDGAYWYFQWSWPGLRGLKGPWHVGALFDTTGSTGSSVYPTVQPRLTGPDGTHYLGGVGTYVETYGLQYASELRELRLTTDMAVEGVQLTGGLSAMPSTAVFAQTGTWSKGAELDDAILPLYAIPRVSGSQWEAIGQIAKAGMSTAEFDERGIFRWRNHTRFSETPTEADLTLTSVRDIASLTLTEEIDACRNYVVQPAKVWEDFGAAAGTTYTDTVVRTVPANGTLTVSYVMAEEEFDIGPPTSDDDSVVTAGSQVRFATTAAGTTAVKGAVDVLTRREDGYLVVRFSNRSSQPLYTATKTGTPSVYLMTLKPKADPVERLATAYTPGSDSERFYGRQEHTGETTDWIQDLASAQDIADALHDAGLHPVPVIGDVEVLYDPRVQLGDVVRLTDTSGTRLDTLAWVIGVNTTAAADNGVRQTLTLRGTQPNGTPADTGLTPDAPVDPVVVPLSTYAQVTAAFPTLAALSAAGFTYGEIKESAYV